MKLATKMGALNCLAALAAAASLGLIGCAGDGHHHHDHGDGKSFDGGLKSLFGHEDSADPPGWDHGRKTGWGGGDEPPGLAKKNSGHSGADLFQDDKHPGDGGDSEHGNSGGAHGKSGSHGKGKGKNHE